MSNHSDPLIILGWREVVSLSELGISRLRAKIDTGAKTSSIDATYIEYHKDDNGLEHVSYVVRVGKKRYQCESPVHEKRHVRSSNGESSYRPVIQTICKARGMTWPIELTLADRSLMRYPMLLGRQALGGHFLVDAGSSYLGGSYKRRAGGGRS